MKKSHNNLLLYLCFILLCFVLFSCSPGNKFAHSFGKRKYTKGYFFNFTSSKNEAVAGVKPINHKAKILPVELANNGKRNNIQKAGSPIPVYEYNKLQIINNILHSGDAYPLAPKDIKYYRIIKSYHNKSVVNDSTKVGENKSAFFLHSKYGLIGDIFLLISIICFCISFSLYYYSGSALSGLMIALFLLSFIINLIAIILCAKGKKVDSQKKFAKIGIILSIVSAVIIGLVLYDIFLFSSDLL